MSNLAEDSLNRQRALDPQRSFIVQAPAGSGKTSLLTQRFLRLLATVNNPEEILAITFTRKAAAEMHQRVIEALTLAQHPEPEEDYLKQMWQLAACALAHDAERNWQLLNNPNRLRIKTIDSLCAHLTKQMPVLARFGSQPKIEVDCRHLYSLAARGVLAEIDGRSDEAEAVRFLLNHLDNKLGRAEELIASMLAKRDQWLRHVMSGLSDKRSALEQVLQTTIEAGLVSVSASMTTIDKQQLGELLGFSAENLDASDPIHQFGKVIDLDNTNVSNLESWQMVAHFLLTSTDDYRKSVNAKLGFPAPSSIKDKAQQAYLKRRKDDYKILLGSLAENPQLLAALRLVRILPSAHYTENQWEFIGSLLTVLVLAVGHLRLVFQQSSCVDFCEVSLSASLALQDASGMTDLGLKLDYQLQHLLVDEFQDTSETQYELLKDIVSGWQPDDGRTLFLVGDPMQSIYRFRQAEVSLFLKTQQQGLGEVKDIESLTISVNFRSQAGIVNWVNQVFSEVMPKQDDMYSSAISYKPSVASKSVGQGAAVNYHVNGSHEQEGKLICSLIESIQNKCPNETIAILVRGRRSLQYLVPELNAAGISFQATDIDPLATRQGVIDLLSLTRACIQPADRVAWLSILRAPWCGLNLDDLLHLVEGAVDENIMTLLQDEQRVAMLSKEGQVRISHVMTHVEFALNQREQMPLSSLVKGLWVNLLGPSCLSSETELEDAYRYFACLAALEGTTDNVDIKTLTKHVENLYSAVDVNASGSLQIMTAHKAKGLQFDHVILLSLDRRSGVDDEPLLAWLERPSAVADESELLVAPIKEIDNKADDSINKYLGFINKQKALHENQRLLYVAATRAKKKLYLSFKVIIDEVSGDIKTPAKNTLLGLLWPSINADIDRNICDNAHSKNTLTDCKLKRIDVKDYLIKKNQNDASQEYSEYDLGARLRQESSIHRDIIEFDWASALASSIGTVSHQLLQLIGVSGVENTEQFDAQFSSEMISNMLLETGVLPHKLDVAVSRIQGVIYTCLSDTRGVWLLDNKHQFSEFEYPITGVLNGVIVRKRLDRTFVSEGVRWIVDYKTGRHDDEDKDVFLDQEMERYKSQLETYAKLMRGLDDSPIKLGLYYPAIQGWRSWDFDD